MKTLAESLLNFALIFFMVFILLACTGCAQASLTGNIINVTVIKAQSSDGNSVMTGSEIDGLIRDLNLKTGDAEIPLRP